MKSSGKRCSSPIKLPSQFQDNDCEVEFDTWISPFSKNPLQQFLKKDKASLFRTMEQLNQRPLVDNKFTLEILRNCKSENLDLIGGSGAKTNGQRFPSILGIAQNILQNNKTTDKKEVKDTVKETEDKTAKKHQKKQSSGLKLSMHEFITIKKANIKEFYTLQQVLGEGAFGLVYRAKCKQTKEERAIKCIKQKQMSQNQTKQFLAETSLLKKISHPSIIKVYDLYSFQNNYYVVMEYCKGGALCDYIEKSKVKSQKIVSGIMKQLLRALTYLHSLNIVHRDIKTGNIVFLNHLTKQNMKGYIPIKIIDFGTAVEMRYKFQRDYPISGTFTYMAPEVLKGFLTQKSDIWSSAVVMIKLLTGVNPFSGSNKREVLTNIKQKIINFEKRPFNHISQEAKDLLTKMFERNMHKRPSAKQLLKHPWFQKCHNEEESGYCLIRLTNTQFYPKNNFIQIIECYLTLQKVNQEQRQRLAQMFNSVDKDGSGHLEKDQFIEMLKNSEIGTSQEQMNNIVNHIDKDKSGRIDFNQFLVAMSNKQKLFIRESLVYAFNHFDSDKTGYIQSHQLKSMLKDCTSQEIQELLKTIDLDKDNKISQEEFIQYLLQ